MKIKIVAGLLITVVAAIVFLSSFVYSNNATVNKEIQFNGKQKLRQISKLERPQTISVCENEEKQLITNGHLYSIKANRIALDSTQIAQEIQVLSEQARQGNSNAALTIFMALNSCAPYTGHLDIESIVEKGDMDIAPGLCKKIFTVSGKDPLSILEPAAIAGSTEVKLMYAKNAERILKIQKFTKITVPDVGRVLSQAEKFGVDAANDGVEQAFSFMARAYQVGTFGVPDLTRAYAFTLALARTTETTELKDRLNFQYAQLSANEVAKAEKLAFGCKRKPDSGSNINPFTPLS